MAADERRCTLIKKGWPATLQVPVPAFAGTIYSNLPTNSPFYQFDHYLVTGPNTNNQHVSQGFLFTAGGTGLKAVSQIDIAFSYGSGANTFTAGIYTDPAGSPGSVVGSIYNFSGDANNGVRLDTITGINDITLTGGQHYFLVLDTQTASDNSQGLWADNVTGANLVNVLRLNGGGWQVQGIATAGAFDVQGSSVAPEPGSMMMLVGGIGPCASLLRRSRTSASEPLSSRILCLTPVHTAGLIRRSNPIRLAMV